VISFLNRTSIARPRTLISSLIFAALIYLFLFPAIFSAIHILPPLNSSDTEVGLSLRNFSGNILVEGSSLALAANKSLEFDPVLFWVLQEKGLWNESQLVSDVRSHKFSVIAFPEYYNRFLLYPDLSAAINSSYTLDYTLNSWRVLVPRNSTG